MGAGVEGCRYWPFSILDVRLFDSEGLRQLSVDQTWTRSAARRRVLALDPSVHMGEAGADLPRYEAKGDYNCGDAVLGTFVGRE
jgi:hypothetical protein